MTALFLSLSFIPNAPHLVISSEVQRSREILRRKPLFLNALHRFPAVACGKDFSIPLTLQSK
jgi:hypothetical protein